MPRRRSASPSRRAASPPHARARATSSAEPRVSLLTRLTHTSVPLAWRARARRHCPYLYSPACYGAAGLFMSAVERGRAHTIPLEFFVWLMQSYLTYMSDVDTLGADSKWHAADRLHAYTFTILRAVYTAYCWQRYDAYSRLQMYVFLIGLGLSMVCIRLSWVGVRRRRVDDFLFWHALWHVSLPLVATLVAILDVCGLGSASS